MFILGHVVHRKKNAKLPQQNPKMDENELIFSKTKLVRMHFCNKRLHHHDPQGKIKNYKIL